MIEVAAGGEGLLWVEEGGGVTDGVWVDHIQSKWCTIHHSLFGAH